MTALKAYLEAGLLDPHEVEAHRHLAMYRGAETRQEYADAFEVLWAVSGG